MAKSWCPSPGVPALQKSLAEGTVAVSAKVGDGGQQTLEGRLAFIDNSVDSASGTIRLKASFANPDGRLWPGMFVTVTLSPHTLAGALTVPVQAGQTGPEQKFVYLVGEDGKVTSRPVRVVLVQDGRAVVESVSAGSRVVVEGAQNLRPGSTVTEAKAEPAKAARQKGKP